MLRVATDIKELEVAVRTIAEQMPWHPDFEGWVQGRIWQEDRREPVIQNLHHFVGELNALTILEVGSGMGGLVVRLQQEQLNVVGIEYNFDYCAITRLRAQRYGLNGSVMNGAAEHLPVKNRSVDIILSYEVIEHVFDPVAMLREMKRVLKDTGMLFLTIPNRWALYDHHYHLWGLCFVPNRVTDRVMRLIGRGKDNAYAGRQTLTDMHYYSWRQFVRLTQAIGFRMVDVREHKLEHDIGLPSSKSFRSWSVRVIRQLGLLRAFYRFYRQTIMNEYHVILTPLPHEKIL